jgi:hypothetical protein
MESNVKFVNCLWGNFDQILVIMEPDRFFMGGFPEVGFKNFDFKFRCEVLANQLLKLRFKHQR